MACDPNTLLYDGRAFQACSDRDQMIIIATLLCDIANGGGGLGGVWFGDPTGGGSLVRGGMAYDNLGNLWIDLDPTGSHDWQKLVTAQAGAGVMARGGLRTVSTLEAPQALPLPKVSIPVSKRLKKAWQYMSLWVLLLLP